MLFDPLLNKPAERMRLNGHGEFVKKNVCAITLDENSDAKFVHGFIPLRHFFPPKQD